MAKYAGKTIFDFLEDIFSRKTNWDSFDQSERKEFSSYMINKWISMDKNYLPVINYLQRYTIGILSPREVYKLYVDLFPKTKFYVKYVKSNAEKNSKISDELVSFMSRNQRWSEKETEENLRMIFNSPTGESDMIEYLKGYGIDEKEIKSKYKLKLK